MATDGQMVETSEQGSATSASDAGFDRSALEAKVAEGLKAIGSFDSEPSDTPEEAPEPKEQVIEEADEASPDEAETPESNETEETQDQQPPKAQPKAQAPTIPAAYRRSLKAYDWTDEEIDAAYAANPATFLVTAQKIHTNRNAEVAKWADAGRATRQPAEEESSGKTATEATASKHVDPKTGAFKPLDVDAMVEKYGNEDMVREIAEPVNQIITQINAMLPDLMHGVNTIKRTRQETLARQIDDFFGGEEIKPYADIYGKDAGSASEEQVQNRNGVLELADALVAGARQQGRNLSVSEALTLAHDMKSSKYNKDKIRTEIRGKVVQRNKGITLRPSHTSGKPEGGPPNNAKDLENRTKARLAKVFG